MLVLALFAVFALGLDAVAVGICALIERFSEFASLLAFLGFFAINFVFAWIAAVYVTERYLLTEEARAANERDDQQREASFRVMRAQRT